MKRAISMLAVLLLGAGVCASAQTLAELAKKEKQRREKLGTQEVKAFDDANLRSAGSVPAAVAPAATDESGQEEPEGKDEEVDPVQTEAYWRSRLKTIDERISEIEARLNTPGFAENPSNLIQRQRYEKDLAEARSQRQEVVEEARRKGVPPGWLR